MSVVFAQVLLNQRLTLVLGLNLFAVYSINTMLSTLLPSVDAEFGLLPFFTGLLISAYGWSYAAMQIPVGIMSDRFEPKRLVLFSMSLYFLTAIAFSFSTNPFSLLISRLVMGIAASFIYVVGLKAIELYYDHSEKGRAMGVYTSIGLLGIAIINSIVPRALQIGLGWRTIYETTSLIALIAVIISLILMPSDILRRSHEKNAQIPINESKKRGALLELLEICRSGQLWIQNIIGCIYWGTVVGLLFWLPSFFEHQGFGLEYGGIAISLMGIGTIFGYPIAGSLIDKMGKKNPILRYFQIGYAILLAGLIIAPPIAVLKIPFLAATFFIGLFVGGLVASTRIVGELFPSRLAGSAYGFYNTWSWIGSSVFPFLIGVVLSYGYSYQFGLVLFEAPLLVSIILSVFSREIVTRLA